MPHQQRLVCTRVHIQVPHIHRQALHAAGMDLEHPASKQRMRFLAPMPKDFVSALQALGLLEAGGKVEGEDDTRMSQAQLQEGIEAAWWRLSH